MLKKIKTKIEKRKKGYEEKKKNRHVEKIEVEEKNHKKKKSQEILDLISN